MLFDGTTFFPNSCVLPAKFAAYQLREMYAALRQREEILQKEIDSTRPIDAVTGTFRPVARFVVAQESVEKLGSFIIKHVPPANQKQCADLVADALIAARAVAYLHEVERWLCWMACNVAYKSWEEPREEKPKGFEQLRLPGLAEE